MTMGYLAGRTIAGMNPEYVSVAAPAEPAAEMVGSLT
jgi:hypothetical protein